MSRAKLRNGAAQNRAMSQIMKIRGKIGAIGAKIDGLEADTCDLEADVRQRCARDIRLCLRS